MLRSVADSGDSAMLMVEIQLALCARVDACSVVDIIIIAQCRFELEPLAEPEPEHGRGPARSFVSTLKSTHE